MEKPVIRIFTRRHNRHVYHSFYCPMANKINGSCLTNINSIFYVLNVAYLCEKDETGQYYTNRSNLKPIFSNGKTTI